MSEWVSQSFRESASRRKKWSVCGAHFRRAVCWNSSRLAVAQRSIGPERLINERIDHMCAEHVWNYCDCQERSLFSLSHFFFYTLMFLHLQPDSADENRFWVPTARRRSNLGIKYSLPKPGLQLKLAAEAETVGFCCLNEVILLYRRAEEEKP